MYGPDWIQSKRRGKPCPRPPGVPTPCNSCPKSDHGRPNPGADWRGRVVAAYQLWLAVRAGLPMPEDLVTIRNCALIQGVVDRVQAQRSDVSAIVGLFAGGRK